MKWLQGKGRREAGEPGPRAKKRGRMAITRRGDPVRPEGRPIGASREGKSPSGRKEEEASCLPGDDSLSQAWDVRRLIEMVEEGLRPRVGVSMLEHGHTRGGELSLLMREREERDPGPC